MLYVETVRLRSIRWSCSSRLWQITVSLNLDGRTFYATHGHIYNENNLPPIQEGDILIHGHTHVLKAEQKEGYVLLNPGSVSIPKEGNPPTYAIFEDGVFTIKDFEGNIVKSIELYREVPSTYRKDKEWKNLN